MRHTTRDTEYVEFVTAQRSPLVRMARLLTAGDEAYAEDLVQTTLTRLYVHWARVRRAGNPVGYARTTLTHAFIDEQRKAHRRRESPTDAPPEQWVTAPDQDLAGPIRAALQRLPPRQRAVVVLRHWLDLDVAETARILSCSTGTVKSQTSKALDHLRTSLGDQLEPQLTEEYR